MHLVYMILRYFKLWQALSGQHNKGASKKQFKDCLKNPFVPIRLIITDGPPSLKIVIPGVSPPTMLSPPLKIITGLLWRTKGGGGTAILCHQALTTSAVATAIMHCSLALTLSIMNIPAVSLSIFMVDIYIYIYIYQLSHLSTASLQRGMTSYWVS